MTICSRQTVRGDWSRGHYSNGESRKTSTLEHLHQLWYGHSDRGWAIGEGDLVIRWLADRKVSRRFCSNYMITVLKINLILPAILDNMTLEMTVVALEFLLVHTSNGAS